MRFLDGCRKLCEELARVGSFEQQAVAQQRLDEIEPAARFAEYQLRRGGNSAAQPEIPASPTTPHLRVCLQLFVFLLIHLQQPRLWALAEAYTASNRAIFIAFLALL